MKTKDEDIFDIGFMFGILRKYIAFVLTVCVVCGGTAFFFSEFLVGKKYQSKARLYVENSLLASESVNISDIDAAQKLVNTCQIIFKSETMMENLIANLDLPYTTGELNKKITAQSENNTEIMLLAVETDSPQESERIVNELVRLADIEFGRVIESGKLKVIDYGKIDTKPSSPNVPIITLIGALAGAAAAYAVAFADSVYDTEVKHGDNIAKLYSIPVFAEIADYGLTADGTDMLLSGKTPFSITEAYNTARTNIKSAASAGKRKIFAVTSAGPSEGKSVTCANIAICFANAGLKVLLAECDLRKPAMAKIFGLKPYNGLSEILGGTCGMTDAVRESTVSGLDIITAGAVPPNPTELLASEAMRDLLAEAAETYDYIFLDTPPVNAVTDSQLMNDRIAGIVFIVRENAATHPEIESALEKIMLANGRPLGFIKTFCRPEKSGRRGRHIRTYTDMPVNVRTKEKLG